MDEPLLWERSTGGPGYWIGEFHCYPGSDKWREHNWIQQGPLMVIPGTAVEIAQDGYEALIADPNHVVFYNDQQGYRRRVIDRRGDHCVFFAVSQNMLAEIIAEHDPAAQDRQDAPYQHCFGPISAQDYLRHLEIFQISRRDGEPDHLYLHEALLALFHSVIGTSYRVRDAAAKPRPTARRRHHQEVVREIQRILGVRFADALSLGDIADAVDLSPFHAARLFREHTGHTIHGYRNRLRLVAGLRRLRDGATSLTELALDLGYSSHSHFTAAFRRAFGVPPSATRSLR